MKTLSALALCMVPAMSFGKTLTIGIDVSGSNPLLMHENFAYEASQYVSTEILKLKPKDVVRVSTFGARENAANVLSTTLVISRKLRPEKAAAMVAAYIRALPKQAEVSQSSTNLLAWLEFTTGFECADGGQILVVTDGLESSSYVSGEKFLTGKQGLPDADVDLKGCALTFYGLGAGWQPQSVKYVRKEWTRWSEQAGATFTALVR